MKPRGVHSLFHLLGGRNFLDFLFGDVAYGLWWFETLQIAKIWIIIAPKNNKGGVCHVTCYLWRIPLNVALRCIYCMKSVKSPVGFWGSTAERNPFDSPYRQVDTYQTFAWKPMKTHEKCERWWVFHHCSDTIPPKNPSPLEWGESGCRIARCAIDVATSRDAGKSDKWGGEIQHLDIEKSWGDESLHFIWKDFQSSFCTVWHYSPLVVNISSFSQNIF